MLSAASSSPFELVGPLSGGEAGATEMRRADGERFVLKWDEDEGTQARRRLGAHFAERFRYAADAWGAYLLRMLTEGGNEYCLHEPLRTFDSRTGRVIEQYEGLGRATDPGVRSRLFAHGVDALPRPKRAVYVANLLLHYLDWSIRKARLAKIDFWLAEIDRTHPSPVSATSTDNCFAR